MGTQTHSMPPDQRALIAVNAIEQGGRVKRILSWNPPLWMLGAFQVLKGLAAGLAVAAVVWGANSYVAPLVLADAVDKAVAQAEQKQRAENDLLHQALKNSLDANKNEHVVFISRLEGDERHWEEFMKWQRADALDKENQLRDIQQTVRRLLEQQSARILGGSR